MPTSNIPVNFVCPGCSGDYGLHFATPVKLAEHILTKPDYYHRPYQEWASLTVKYGVPIFGVLVKGDTDNGY